MLIRNLLMTGSALAVASLVAFPAVSQDREYRPVTNEMLLNPDPADWLTQHRTVDAWHYSPLDEINRDTVGDLRMVWGWAMEPGGQEATPIIHDGIMFIVNPGGILQALDAATGDLIWEYRREMPAGFPPGAYTRGVALHENNVIYATPDAAVVALDAVSGSIVWETQSGDPDIGKRYTAAPIVVNGTIVTGMSGCSTFVEEKCAVIGYDATNGEELWRVITIQEPGTDNDTWDDIPMLFRTGGDPWTTGSYDPETNLVYIASAQAKPWSRASRGHDGDALYTLSTLAINIDSGEVEWYRQYIPGESHDMDDPFEHVLVDIDGQPSYVTMGKLAILWRGNRVTGESYPAFDLGLQDQIDIDPDTGEFVDYREGMLPEIGVAMEKCPSTAGFKSWRTMSYSPETNAVYIPMSLHCDAAAIYAEVEMVEGGGGTAKPGRVNVRHPDYPDGIGLFHAMNIETGETLWQHEMLSPANTAMLGTAGGLVFGGDWDRNLYAFDEETGEVLWQQRLPQAPQGFISTYAVDGKQYIAVPVGVGGASWSTSVPADLVPEIRRPAAGNAVLVFALPD